MARRGMTVFKTEFNQTMVLLFVFVIVMCFLYAVYLVAEQYCEMPIAQISTATGECVKVIGSDHTCDDLPKKYITEWVR